MPKSHAARRRQKTRLPDTQPYVPLWMGQFAVARYRAPELSYWGKRKKKVWHRSAEAQLPASSKQFPTASGILGTEMLSSPKMTATVSLLHLCTSQINRRCNPVGALVPMVFRGAGLASLQCPPACRTLRSTLMARSATALEQVAEEPRWRNEDDTTQHHLAKESLTGDSCLQFGF